MSKPFKNKTPIEILTERRDQLEEGLSRREERRRELDQEIKSLELIRNEFTAVIYILENQEE